MCETSRYDFAEAMVILDHILANVAFQSIKRFLVILDSVFAEQMGECLDMRCASAKTISQ